MGKKEQMAGTTVKTAQRRGSKALFITKSGSAVLPRVIFETKMGRASLSAVLFESKMTRESVSVVGVKRKRAAESDAEAILEFRGHHGTTLPGRY